MLRALALVLALCLPSAAYAQIDLASLSSALGGTDEGARDAAIQSLRTLPPTMREAITDRIGDLVRRPLETTRADELLTALRRATGSRRADDIVDVADGVASVLAADRSPEARRVCEAILLARALESHGTADALRDAVEILRMPGNGMAMEGRRFTLRLGPRVAGTVLRSLGHGDVHVREWSRWSVHRLGLDEPGTYVRSASPSVLADVLTAYGEARLMSAMPVVGSFVDAPQRTVREAAFAGLAAYGRNALWTIREAYRLHADADADTAWGAERTLEGLREAIERARLAAAQEALTGARAALDGGDAERAAALVDEVLLARPELGSVEIARIYYAAGERALAAGEGALSRRHFVRAERLALLGSDGDLSRRARGALTFVDAELSLAEGTLDVDAYARAAAALPEDVRIHAVADGYGETGTPADHTLPLALAALLFLSGAVLVVRPSAPPPPPTPAVPEGDAAITSPG